MLLALILEDGVIGFFNADYGEPLSIQFEIDLQKVYHVREIRYTMGNVQRADTWGADEMVTPFGTTPVFPGSEFSGNWTIQTGSVTTSRVSIELRKARVSLVTDWMFIGEVVICGETL